MGGDMMSGTDLTGFGGNFESETPEAMGMSAANEDTMGADGGTLRLCPRELWSYKIPTWFC